MTREEKELLLKDLGARLLCGVNIQIYCEETGYFDETLWAVDNAEPFHINNCSIEHIKPYLRPISSMTEDERNELSHYENSVQRTDFFYSHHIDCRFMIEKGLALEAPEGMYNIQY